MELKYLWIDEYKNINNTGFNLDYDGDDEFYYRGKKIIITSKQNKTIKGFFGSTITGVTGIVGENGSGKTNLTEFLNYNLAHVTNGGLSTFFKGLRGIIIIDNYIFYQETIKIENGEVLSSLGYRLIPYDHAPLDKQGGMNWAEMSKTKYIYYCPHFEFRYINMQDNLFNISTSYLAYNAVYESGKHYTSFDLEHRFYLSNRQKTDSLTAYYINEKIREADFIMKYDSERLLGTSPVKLVLSVDNDDNKLLTLVDQPDELSKRAWSFLEDMERNLSYQILQSIRESKQAHPDRQYYILSEVNKDERISLFQSYFTINLYKILINNREEISEDFFNQPILNYTLFNNPILQENLKVINDKLMSLLELVDILDTTVSLSEDFESLNGDQLLQLIDQLTISLNTKHRKIDCYEFISAYKKLTNNSLAFHYQFENDYSSGQQNILNFYSRFFAAYNELLDDEKRDYEFKKDKLIIFIDEGEIAFHPEWQRTFFNKAISFIKDLFKDRKIQLIVTTHSPFVLSDLPIGNIILLQKDDKGNTVINSKKGKKTFGANIHTLFSDAFFLKSTLGEFAENKLKGVLKTLSENAKDISAERKTEIKFIIDSVGEPIIKQQFEYLYNKVFGNDELEFLRQRVRDLENKINTTADDTSEY